MDGDVRAAAGIMWILVVGAGIILWMGWMAFGGIVRLEELKEMKDLEERWGNPVKSGMTMGEVERLVELRMRYCPKKKPKGFRGPGTEWWWRRKQD